MSLFNSLDRDQYFGEFATPRESQGSGVLTPAIQRLTAIRNLFGDASITLAQIVFLSGVTAGTVTASKAVVVDANKDIATFRNVRGALIQHSIPGGAHAAVSTAGAGTYTAANLLTGKIVRDPASGNRVDTLDTAANLVAAIPGVAVGDEITVKVINDAAGANTVTIAAGSGGTFGSTNKTHVLAQNTSTMLIIRITNITASSEAYVIYE